MELKSIEEIAEKLFDLSCDMDYMDYEEQHEEIKADLENALYQLKAIAENDLNKDYWRTLYEVLQRI